MTKKLIALIVLSAALILSSCSNTESSGQSAEAGTTSASETAASSGSSELIEDPNGYFSKSDLNPSYDESSSTAVALGDSDVEITKAGTYIITGTLADGQIVVDVDKTEKVNLVFNGVTISCSDSAAVYVKSADKVIITLADGSVNTLSDGKSYVYASKDETEPNACLYSSEDLTINGTGSLKVTGNYNNGIGCKNDLKFVGATVTVYAANNALKGKDSVSVWSGNITVTGADDAIKSDDETDLSKGFIYICGGTVSLSADDDGLQATNSVTVSGGTVTINVGGKSINCDGKVSIADGCLIEK